MKNYSILDTKSQEQTEKSVSHKNEIKKDWIEEFLKNVSTNNVQKLADFILAEAIDNSYGIAKDDMTVIVCKIVKKK